MYKSVLLSGIKMFYVLEVLKKVVVVYEFCYGVLNGCRGGGCEVCCDIVECGCYFWWNY